MPRASFQHELPAVQSNPFCSLALFPAWAHNYSSNPWSSRRKQKFSHNCLNKKSSVKGGRGSCLMVKFGIKGMHLQTWWQSLESSRSTLHCSKHVAGWRHHEFWKIPCFECFRALDRLGRICLVNWRRLGSPNAHFRGSCIPATGPKRECMVSSGFSICSIARPH